MTVAIRNACSLLSNSNHYRTSLDKLYRRKMLSTVKTCLQRCSLRAISLSSQRSKTFEINDNTEFVNKVMNSQVPVIVNFHAEWCDPCKILTPKLTELIGPMTELNLAIVNVEMNPELVHTFEVKAVPAVIAVSNGLVVDKFIGLVDADMIDNLVKKLKTISNDKSTSSTTIDTPST